MPLLGYVAGFLSAPNCCNALSKPGEIHRGSQLFDNSLGFLTGSVQLSDVNSHDWRVIARGEVCIYCVIVADQGRSISECVRAVCWWLQRIIVNSRLVHLVTIDPRPVNASS